ncbi:MAG: hypothetical protein U5J99_05380 [Parvularculaceae bacterium]|nr:hypothetical protein [Parvularculaceae bacterium]
MPPHFFTIVARNYLSFALTLRASLLAAHPGVVFRIVLADEAPNEATLALIEALAPGAAADLVAARDLPIPDFADMTMRYDVMELATAVKPFAFRHMLAAAEGGPVIYLDPDILVTAPLDCVLDALASGADAVLTPHHRAPPPDDGKTPTAADIAAAGCFNLGFAAFADTPGAHGFLIWWADACATRCFSAPERGLFVDQKFVDEAPARIPGLVILEAPGLNAAYWNLHERPLGRADDGTPTAGGQRLQFFHFSGVAPGDGIVLSRHQTRHHPDTIGAVGAGLLADYRARLAAFGHEAFRTIPYAWGHYPDGSTIPRAARRLYARRKDAGEAVLPFDPDLAFLNAPEPGVAHGGAPVTRLMAEIWRERPDLQAAFPLNVSAGRAGLRRWFLAHGPAEYGVGSAHLAPAAAGGAGAVLKIARGIFRSLPPPLQEHLRRGRI